MLADLELTEIEAAVMAWKVDPSLMMADCGLEPDKWQSDVLLSGYNRELMICSRQVGKSTVAAFL